MATSRLRGKGVTSIASSAIRLDELLDVYVREVSSVMAGEKVLMFFFPPKISEMLAGRWWGEGFFYDISDNLPGWSAHTTELKTIGVGT